MPQSLEETEFPGATPKGAVLFTKPKTKEVFAVAPIYTVEQEQRARQHGEELGLRYVDTATIYSLSDLERVETDNDIKTEESLKHKSGCIFASTGHPGECYVESKSPDIDRATANEEGRTHS